MYIPYTTTKQGAGWLVAPRSAFEASELVGRSHRTRFCHSLPQAEAIARKWSRIAIGKLYAAFAKATRAQAADASQAAQAYKKPPFFSWTTLLGLAAVGGAIYSATLADYLAFAAFSALALMLLGGRDEWIVESGRRLLGRHQNQPPHA